MEEEESERIEEVEEKKSGLKVGVAITAVGCLLALLCGGGLSLLAWFLIPVVEVAETQAESVACQQSLAKLHGGLLIYQTKKRCLPTESGVAFLAVLYATEAVEPTERNAHLFTCPAVDPNDLAIGRLPWHEWWTDLDRLDSTWSAYAGRNNAEFPLEKLTGREPLAACDNEHGQNHPDVTHVLYGDGSVQTFSLEELKRQGVVPQDADRLIVGSDSPIEDLRKLSLD